MNLDDGDWRNLLYLLLLLAMMLAGIFSQRDLNFKKILKYLGAWSVVGLILIVLYSYRYEFDDFKQRILGELNPSLAQKTNSGEIVVSAAQDGHFYLSAKVNGGLPISFMVDTGASDVVISLDEAKKLGINVAKLDFNKRYQTANGMVRGASVVLDEIEFGGVKFYNVSVSVNGAEMGTSLMGVSFLKRFKKYEVYRDRLILTI